MGYRKLSARPRHHAQAEGAIEHFKKLPGHSGGIARENGVDPADIEVWFGDGARDRARRTRSHGAGPGGEPGPSAPQDQRTASTYIFGAICPKEGKRRPGPDPAAGATPRR